MEFFNRSSTFVNQLLGDKPIKLNEQNIGSYISAAQSIIDQKDRKKIEKLRLTLIPLSLLCKDRTIKNQIDIVLEQTKPTAVIIPQVHSSNVSEMPIQSPRTSTVNRPKPEIPETDLELAKFKFLQKCLAKVLVRTQDTNGNAYSGLRYNFLSKYENPMEAIEKAVESFGTETSLTFTTEQQFKIAAYSQDLNEFYRSIQEKYIPYRIKVQELINDPEFKAKLSNRLKPPTNLSREQKELQRVIDRILRYFGDKDQLDSSMLKEEQFINCMMSLCFHANLINTQTPISENDIQRETVVFQSLLTTRIESKLKEFKSIRNVTDATMKALLRNEAMKVVFGELLPYEFVLQEVLAPGKEVCSPDVMTRLIDEPPMDRSRRNCESNLDALKLFVRDGF